MEAAKRTVLILCCLMVASSSWAGSKEEAARRLNFGLRIFPLILAADQDLSSKKHESGSLLLLLIYENDREGAEKIKENLAKKKIKKMPVEIEITDDPGKDRDPSNPPAGLFLTEHLPEVRFKTVVDFGIKEKAIVFSPILGDVERGATAGIYISRSPRPSLNLTTLKDSEIRINKKVRKLSKKYK